MRIQPVSNVFLATGLALVLSAPARCQSYGFTKILDGATQRPDGLGVFFIPFTRTTPAFDGQWVAFRDPGPQNDDGSHAAIWSFNTQDRTFHKLVDLRTPIPGGGATFHDLQLQDTAPDLQNGTVVFQARDTLARPGLYSIPVAGGTIVKIADRGTADPSGGTFNLFDVAGNQMGGFGFDGLSTVFVGSNGALVPGVYSANPDGTQLGLIADSLHPVVGGRVNGFYAPAVSGSNVVMVGTDSSPGNTGYNGIYLGIEGGNGGVIEQVNSTQPLPDDPTVGFHTRFDAPALGIDAGLVAFHATDSRSGTTGNPSGLSGLYTTDLGLHTIEKIADVNSTLPGLGRLGTVGSGGISVSRGSVLFQAADITGATALYVWRSGTIVRVIGSGDTLDGRTVRGVAVPGAGALNGSALAFVVDFGGDRAMYLATPPASSVILASVGNAASYGVSSIAPGEIVALFGAGMGPSTLTLYQFDANNRIPTQLAGVRVRFNDISAPLIHVSDRQIAAIVPYGIVGEATASVVVEYNGAISAPVTVPVTNTMPGIFSAATTGSGQGAIQNSDISANNAGNPAAAGSVVVLWVAGLGPLVPPQVDGSIVQLRPLPALQYPVSVSIGGRPAEIQYQGPGPLSVAGLYQINCVIPPETASGTATVVVSADGRSSQPNLTLVVK